MSGRYITPFLSFGFRRLFREASNSDLLIDLLNELLRNEQRAITSVSYIVSEELGNSVVERWEFIDLLCEDERGGCFIVELQQAKHNFFRDRMGFFSSFPIQRQVLQGGVNVKVKAVYMIGILDFAFRESANEPEFVHREPYPEVAKSESHHHQDCPSDRLTYIYLELPKFNKTEDQLETKLDKWLYILRNMGQLSERPARLQEQIFEKLFIQADVTTLTRAERGEYESSLKHYRDLNNVVEAARERGRRLGFDEGLAEGRRIGRDIMSQSAVRRLADAGMAEEQIAAMMGLQLVEVTKLLSS